MLQVEPRLNFVNSHVSLGKRDGAKYGRLKRADFLNASLESTATRRVMSERFEDIYMGPIVEAKRS